MRDININEKIEFYENKNKYDKIGNTIYNLKLQNAIEVTKTDDISMYTRVKEVEKSFSDYNLYVKEGTQEYALVIKLSPEHTTTYELYALDFIDEEKVSKLVSLVSATATTKKTGVSLVLSVFGWSYIVAGALIGIVLFSEDLSFAMTILFSSILFGVLLLGLSAINHNISEINRKTK